MYRPSLPGRFSSLGGGISADSLALNLPNIYAGQWFITCIYPYDSVIGLLRDTWTNCSNQQAASAIDPTAFIRIQIAVAGWGGFRNSSQVIHTLGDIIMRAHVRIPSVFTNMRVWVSLDSGIFPDGSDDPAPGAGNLFGFRYSPIAADANWMAYCGNIAGSSIANTGISIAANINNYVTLDAQYKYNEYCRFWINGAEVAILAANLPASSGMRTHMILRSTDAVQKTAHCTGFYAACKRSWMGGI